MALQAAACCSSPTRHTPLHLASHDGNTRLVGALLDCGARWDLRDRGGNTPLFLACELGHDTVVDALLVRPGILGVWVLYANTHTYKHTHLQTHLQTHTYKQPPHTNTGGRPRCSTGKEQRW